MCFKVSCLLKVSVCRDVAVFIFLKNDSFFMQTAKKENETIVFKNDFFCKKLAVSLTIVNDDPSLTIAERRRLETALKDIGIRCMSFFQPRLFVNDR